MFGNAVNFGVEDNKVTNFLSTQSIETSHIFLQKHSTSYLVLNLTSPLLPSVQLFHHLNLSNLSGMTNKR